MNGFDWINAPAFYAEFGRDSLSILGPNGGLDLPLDRLPDRRLTEACKARVIARLHDFLQPRSWQSRPRVVCAIGARGVSLRRVFLPPSSREDLPRLLALQIESEFPLPPEALAWGYSKLGDAKPDDPRPGQEVLVVAARKEILDEYSNLLNLAGAHPVFTLAALARAQLCPRPPADHSVLDIGARDSELVTFQQGAPASLRTMAWGSASSATLVAPAPSSEPGSSLPYPGSDLGSLARELLSHPVGRAIYLTGAGSDQPELASHLARHLGNGLRCETILVPQGAGQTAATLGLRQGLSNETALPPIILLRVNQAQGPRTARPAPLKWAALAAALLLAVLAFPYLEAILLKPHLARKLQAITAEKGRLAAIDRELDFLRYLKQNQPNYLDAIFLLSKATQPGTRFDSLSLNKRGDLSLHGPMPNGQQVGEFRAKLIDSGVFTNIAIEEQTPSPDRQRVIIRLSAQWKQTIPDQALTAGPGTGDKAKTKIDGKNLPMAGSTTSPPPAAVVSISSPSPVQLKSTPSANHSKE